MDFLRIAARVAAGPVPVEMAIYDNTQVTPEELVSAVDDIPFFPCWFSQHHFGWLAVGADPATLTPETPVTGAPFGEKTWGEIQANGYYEGAGDDGWRQCASPADVLSDDNLLWWFTSGEEQDREELVAALEERGHGELAARAQALAL